MVSHGSSDRKRDSSGDRSGTQGQGIFAGKRPSMVAQIVDLAEQHTSSEATEAFEGSYTRILTNSSNNGGVETGVNAYLINFGEKSFRFESFLRVSVYTPACSRLR